MKHSAIPLLSITASMLLFGCVTRTVVVRPVAPVVEARSAPVTAAARLYPAPPPAPAPVLSGASSVAQDADSGRVGSSENPTGVRVEAVIPGVSTGRSLLFETDKLTRPGILPTP